MSTELATLEAKAGALQVTSVASSMELAGHILRSGLAPESFKTKESIMIAVQMGAELGLKPMQSLQSIAVIGQRPCIWGKAIAGIVLASGLCESLKEWIEGTGDNMIAKCTAKRKGVAAERTAEFSVQDAKLAKLWGKVSFKGTPSPWVLYPRDMLGHKARSRCLGVLFADVLCGIPVYEDYQDTPADRRIERDTPAHDPLLSPVSGPVIKSVEAETPANEIPEPGSFDGDVEEPTAYVGFAKRVELATTVTELNKIAAEAAAAKNCMTDDQKNELQNLYKDRVKDFKK